MRAVLKFALSLGLWCAPTQKAKCFILAHILIAIYNYRVTSKERKKGNRIFTIHDKRQPDLLNTTKSLPQRIEGLFLIVTFFQVKYYRSFWTLKA